MKLTKHTATILMSLLLCLGLLGVAGCGSEQDKPDNTIESAEKTTESSAVQKKKKLFLAFGGGPTGGTFNFFASKISAIVTHDRDHLDIAPKGSAGSADNLRALNLGSVDMSIVYSGDAFLGREGLLEGDMGTYGNVRALAYLYGAPAQLVVRADSNITSAKQLAGKIVAVGNPGSGAALSAQRFFTRLGIWDEIEHRNQGYSQAAADFADGKIDGFWVLAGFPNSAIIEASSRVTIRLIPVGKDAEESGLFTTMPFYTPIKIPANTYQGQTEAIASFQDAAMLCTAEGTAPETVYDVLATIFSKQGLDSLVNAHRAAKDMSVQNGITGISIPLHPGAVTFWEERGLIVPASIK